MLIKKDIFVTSVDLNVRNSSLLKSTCYSNIIMKEPQSWFVNNVVVDACRSRSAQNEVQFGSYYSRLWIGLNWCEHLMEVYLGGNLVDA